MKSEPSPPTGFYQTFQTQLEQGTHITACVVDPQGDLQWSEIYGARWSDPKSQTIELFLAKTHAEAFFTAALKNQRVAINLCHPMTFETFQIKGRVVLKEPLQDEDLAESKFWEECYFSSLRLVGIPEPILSNLNYVPDHRVEVKLETVFVQTPSIGTGQPW